MIKRWYRSLLNQPRPVRDRYAFTGALVVTFFVTVTWLNTFSLAGTLSIGGQTATVVETESVKSSDARRMPFSYSISQLRSSFAELFTFEQATPAEDEERTDLESERSSQTFIIPSSQSVSGIPEESEQSQLPRDSSLDTGSHSEQVEIESGATQDQNDQSIEFNF